MPNIEIKDLNEEITITEDELKHVKGGLLPAYEFSYHKLPTTSYKINVSLDSSIYKF